MALTNRYLRQNPPWIWVLMVATTSLVAIRQLFYDDLDTVEIIFFCFFSALALYSVVMLIRTIRYRRRQQAIEQADKTSLPN